MKNYLEEETNMIYSYEDDVEEIYIKKGLKKLTNKEYNTLIEEREIQNESN